MGTLENAIQGQDAARRISDTIALHLEVARQNGDILDVVNRWCAFRLDDGTSDGEHYPTKDDAMRMQKSRRRDYFYMQITPDGISVHNAHKLMNAFRHPMIDQCAPAHVSEPAMFPRHSNLTREQRQTLERNYREQH